MFQWHSSSIVERGLMGSANGTLISMALLLLTLVSDKNRSGAEWENFLDKRKIWKRWWKGSAAKSCLVSRCLSCTSGANVCRYTDTDTQLVSLYLSHTAGLGDKLLCLFYWQTDKQSNRQSKRAATKLQSQWHKHGRISEYAYKCTHPHSPTGVICVARGWWCWHGSESTSRWPLTHRNTLRDSFMCGLCRSFAALRLSGGDWGLATAVDRDWAWGADRVGLAGSDSWSPRWHSIKLNSVIIAMRLTSFATRTRLGARKIKHTIRCMPWHTRHLIIKWMNE